MIKYNFGEIDCRIDFKDFLDITCGDIKKYKSEFKEFSQLYEFIETNKNKITHILFDGYEYHLKKGLLHNLFGPALIRHTPDGYFPGTSNNFYIDGKLVHDDTHTIGKGCKSLESFQTKNIFHFKELNQVKTRIRRKIGVDYEIYPIDLKRKIRKDKLEKINDSIESGIRKINN